MSGLKEKILSAMLALGIAGCGNMTVLQDDVPRIKREIKNEQLIPEKLLDAFSFSYEGDVMAKWKTGRNLVFACNNLVDFNKDGMYEFGEIIGLKNRFSPGEPMATVVACYDAKDKKLEAVYKQGDVILNRTTLCEKIEKSNFLYIERTQVPLDSNNGSCTVEVYLDNKIIGSMKLAITR